MTRLARWCFTHRRTVLAAWLLILIVALGTARGAGGAFNSSLSLPGTDSQAAVSLLTQHYPAAAGETDQVVIQATGGATIQSPQVRGLVTQALARVSAVPGIASVASPYAATGASQVGGDGTVAFARVTWDRQPDQVTAADAGALITAARSADGPDVHVSLGGASITNSERAKPGPSVAVGVLAALVILLIVFGGAILAALTPLAGAALALVIGSSSITLLSHGLTVASASTDLAVLIGLGVGVDYGLFILSRHRAAVRAGRSYEDAAAEAVNTSGRTVLFAGLTVCLALLGQFALGVGFLDGLSVAAAVTVALTIATALTLLPALLGFLGPRVLSRRERAALAGKGPVGENPQSIGSRWARLVERHSLLTALASVAAITLIALPVLGLRLGTSDASTDPASWTTHQSYAALAHGFGPGFNGPLELAGQVRTTGDLAAFSRLLATAERTPGVATITPSQVSPDRHAVLATLYPATAPQDRRTITLVSTLRDSLIPRAEHGSGLVAHVGGQTATAIDFAHVLGSKLPLFVAVVVILAFILLAAVFRSLLIPVVASALNLISVVAALGAITAVFTKGWASSLLGLSGTGPVDAFLPVVMFSVLFGLSMDYEVYTVSRMQEEWRRLPSGPGPQGAAWRNHTAVTAGQAHSTRIVAAAAGIMILVFGSFLPGGHHLLQEFGFGLGFSVLIDAILIRSMLLPAVMHLIGPANWYLPARLAHALPRLDIEAGEADAPAPTGPREPTRPAA
jgi:putative drug exporter of the RND superfamily